MNPRALAAPALAGALTLAGCATRQDLVVVLPERDGHVGAVVVNGGGGQAVLATAYAAATADRGGPRPLKTGAMDDGKVREIFGDALGALPEPPLTQPLYFKTNSVELTPASAEALNTLLETIKARKAVEIVLTGHTDTTGTDDYDDQLSRRRAEAIRDVLRPVLKRYGIADDSIMTAGRGKRELLVPTPDQFPEPRNRRVDITLR